MNGSSPDIISGNISELRRSGYPEKQAIAIAYDHAGKSKAKKKKAKKDPESPREDRAEGSEE